MARSIKKGPFIDAPLSKAIADMNAKSEKRVYKTWSRRSTVIPEMVGHKLGEFSPTRVFKGHSAGGSAKEKSVVPAGAPPTAAATAPPKA